MRLKNAYQGKVNQVFLSTNFKWKHWKTSYKLCGIGSEKRGIIVNRDASQKMFSCNFLEIFFSATNPI